jgi:hypothetical protein
LLITHLRQVAQVVGAILSDEIAEMYVLEVE